MSILYSFNITGWLSHLKFRKIFFFPFQYRNQLSLQQDARLHLQREALQQRQAELRSVDQRILELQNRLHKKKASTLMQQSGNGSVQQQQQHQQQQQSQQQNIIQQNSIFNNSGNSIPILTNNATNK